MDGVLVYLGKHGQHVGSVDISRGGDGAIALRQLPPLLQLSSLHLSGLDVQLQPGNGSHGVLGSVAVAALKQLWLTSCELLDGEAQLAAALSQLPAGLQHLSITAPWVNNWSTKLPTGALQRLQQLTYLELADVVLQSPVQGQPVLQPLQALTRLQDLRLCTDDGGITASMLSGTHHLARLWILGCLHHIPSLEPGALAGKTQLQHLQLVYCTVSGGAAGAAQLLSHLQSLQQLRHLDLGYSKWEGSPPAAAFSALTASSKLQHLDIRRCKLPAGLWQHVFPAGKQLPHLTSLDISRIAHADAGGTGIIPGLEGSRLVSCCPSLESLNVVGLQVATDVLAAVQELRKLHTLHLAVDATTAADRLHGVCQLTGLRDVGVVTPMNAPEELLLQLTQFRQLTSLTYNGAFRGDRDTIRLAAKVSCA
jgi:hypothetical protein